MDTLRSPNRRPTHPGELLREDVFPALGLTQEQLAKRLGVTRVTINELLHEKRSLSPEMAARLGKFLDTSPDSWLAMQMAVDLWEAQQMVEVEEIEPFRRKRSAG